MERTNSKTRNWFSRFKNLRIHKLSRASNSNFDDVVLRNNYPSSSSDNTRTKSSFRKSLLKMHKRMKNCVIKKRSRNVVTSRHTIHVSEYPTTSNGTQRITLRSKTSNIENIYSLDPIQRIESSPNQASPVVPLRHTISSPVMTTSPTLPPRKGRGPTDEILSLSNCYWYWGPLTRVEAEDKLKGFPDGAFLIRDSSSTSYLFTISFRSVGKTLHCRIEYNRGRYSLFDQRGYASIIELIEKAMEISSENIYCYSRNRDDTNPNFPVRLTKPISRYTIVRSLKFLCRFVIRQRTNINDIPKLPLPSSVKSYLQEGAYF